MHLFLGDCYLQILDWVGAFERTAERGSLNVLHESMQNKFSEFSEQPNVVCLLLMLGCTTVSGGDLGLGILKPITWSCLGCSKIHIFYPPNNTMR
jgi:hypothetical protein